jgi:hypothetical protein
MQAVAPRCSFVHRASTTCEQLDATTKQKKFFARSPDNFKQLARSAREDSILDL